MTETKLHINYCQSFGLSLKEVTDTEEHQGSNFPFPPAPLSLSLILILLTPDTQTTLTHRSLHSLHPLRTRHRAVPRLPRPADRHGALPTGILCRSTDAEGSQGYQEGE